MHFALQLWSRWTRSMPCRSCGVQIRFYSSDRAPGHDQAPSDGSAGPADGLGGGLGGGGGAAAP